jgi:hypothetical protein
VTSFTRLAPRPLAFVTSLMSTLPRTYALPVERSQVAGIVPAWWASAIALLPFLLLTAMSWSMPPLFDAGDYAQYLAHASAIVQGRPYTDIGLIGTPYNALFAPPAYPPGLPFTLVPFASLGTPEMMAAGKLLMLVCGVAFLLLATRYFTRTHGAALGTLSGLIAGVALGAAYATNTVLSDLGFCALTWAVLLLGDTSDRWSWPRTFAITVLGAVAIAYRLAAVALIVALVFSALMRRRELGARSLVPLAAWLLTLGAIVTALPVAGMLGGHTRFGLGHLASYRSALTEATLYPFFGKVPNALHHLLALGLLLIGAWTWLRSARRSLLLGFTATTAALLVVFPVASGRYLWPLFPLLALWMVLGLHQVVTRVIRAARWSSVSPDRVVASLVGLLCASAMLVHVLKPDPLTLLGRPDTDAMLGAMRGFAAHEPVRAMFVNPRVLTLETHVPAMVTFTAPPDVFVTELGARHITHVVTADLGSAPHDEAALRASMRAYPARFTPVFQRGAFFVYRFR